MGVFVAKMVVFFSLNIACDSELVLIVLWWYYNFGMRMRSERWRNSLEHVNIIGSL